MPAGRGRRAAATAVILAVAALAAACGGVSRADADTGGTRVVKVLAAENFWGSIVSQLGGAHVDVISVVSDPNADPHDYESSARDARDAAMADYVVENGAGYDSWCDKLLSVENDPGRRVLNVGGLLGARPGDNPHFWYDPDDVGVVENRVEADLKAIDPADAGYFTARRTATDAAFAPMRAQLAQIRQAYGGQPVASTESIVAYLADDLGLRLISPGDFMDAVSEGNDPPPASIAAFQRLLTGRQVRVLIVNDQTATSLTGSITRMAAAGGIPVVGVTETIQPPDTPYQTWFGGELAALQRALAQSSPGRSPATPAPATPAPATQIPATRTPAAG